VYQVLLECLRLLLSPGKVPAELERNFASYYQVARLQNVARVNKLGRVLRSLSEAAVDAWPMKGAVLLPWSIAIYVSGPPMTLIYWSQNRMRPSLIA
jgi:hypothetical protein